MKLDSCKLPFVLSVFFLLLLQDHRACSARNCETSEECTTWTLCSEYNSTEESPCKGRLKDLSLISTSSKQFDYTIQPSSPLSILFGLNVTYNVHIIHGACEGAVVTNPTQFPQENSTTCVEIGSVITDNKIEVTCGNHFINTEGSGISVRNCSDLCVDLYLVEYTSCSCEVEGGSSVSWDECARVDVSRVLPSQSEECLRRQCLAAGNVSCELKCTNSQCDAMSGQPVCQRLCEDPFQGSLLSGLNVSKVIEFCANQIRSRSCSNLTLLDRDCENHLENCSSICLPQNNEVAGFLLDGCPLNVFKFCTEKYINKSLLSPADVSSDVFTTSVRVLQGFVGKVPQSLILSTLSNLFLTDQPGISLQAILGLFDNLFDIGVSYQDSYDSLSEVLRLLETRLELISADLLKLNEIMPFNFDGSNLFVSVGAPNRTQSVDNRTTVELKGGENLADFHVSVSVSTDVLCEANETERCSSVVALAAVNNLADKLHQAALNSTSEEELEFSEFEPATDLLSIQMFGVEDLRERLLDSPVEFVITLPMHNVTERVPDSIECVFWNHTLNLWSNQGVKTRRMDTNTVQCSSKHLTSFAVLVSLNSNVSTKAQSIATYIGCAFSILCLLATIICLIIFRKILNKGPLLYVHLNLSIALLLGYLFFMVGVETAVNIPGLCITLAALMQYFFLASFCWMLCEGIMLYLLVVIVFGTAAQRWYWLLIPGWGIPLPIVIISAGVLQKQYIHTQYCWLNTVAAIWTFIVPMLAVILVNTVILVLTVVSIVRGRKKGGAETTVKTRTLVITALKGTIILLPLLGITWVIGLFAVNENTQVFAWIFVILNSFQGVLIFLLHVLRNPALLKKMRQVYCRRRTKSSTTTGATTTSKLGAKPVSLDSSARPVSPSFASVSDPLHHKNHSLSPTLCVEPGSDALMESKDLSV